MFTASLRSNSSAEYSVVVFPLPVGPVTRIIPYGLRSMPSIATRSFPWMPSSPSSKLRLLLSSRRMTIFSPSTVGMLETRRSISRPSATRCTRPSCGSRFSEMSIRPTTLMRDTSAACIARGGVIMVRRAPSTRWRICVLSRSGSMWMSLAPSRRAVRIARFTRLITGLPSIILSRSVTEPSSIASCSEICTSLSSIDARNVSTVTSAARYFR